MKYHLEIDALNALVAEVRKTNELLEKLLERGSGNVLHENEESRGNDAPRRKRHVHVAGNQDGNVQPNPGPRRGRPARHVGN